MLLIHARREARVGKDGQLVLLADQNRGQWDRALIKEGLDLVRRCLRINKAGPYQLQAAIQAGVAAETDRVATTYAFGEPVNG
jgi:RNA polymerase sigma-70 factor (ECF subfamily)